MILENNKYKLIKI